METATLDAIIKAIQTVGFPAVAFLVICALIYFLGKALAPYALRLVTSIEDMAGNVGKLASSVSESRGDIKEVHTEVREVRAEIKEGFNEVKELLK